MFVVTTFYILFCFGEKFVRELTVETVSRVSTTITVIFASIFADILNPKLHVNEELSLELNS